MRGSIHLHLSRGLRHGPGRPIARLGAHLGAAPTRGVVTKADVQKARTHCMEVLRHGDHDAYLLRPLIQQPARDVYDALRTLNLELARLPETVSSPTMVQFRVQFWKDLVVRTFAGEQPREPISVLLHHALSQLAAKEGSSTRSASSIKFWLLRFIGTREKHMDNRPFASLSALEEYAENTYATMMYMTLAAKPMCSVDMDHLASHIGKACGIVAVLRGIAVLAAPRAPVGRPGTRDAGHARQALLLPLDVMAEVGLREEDVFRHGPEAPGLQDAVFKVATRANDHLITAREMLKNIKEGEDAGHAYEHQGDSGHSYEDTGGDSPHNNVRRGFPILMESLPASDYLDRIEAANFNPFAVKKSWKLPWKFWRSLKQQKI